MTTPTGAEERVRGLARACVRTGLMSAEEVHDEVAQAIRTDLPDRAPEAEDLASTWVAEAHDDLRADQRDWPESTDHERLESAFAELELLDVSVLQGCHGRADAERLVDASAPAGLRGVVWFTRDDVWRAVDEGVLPLRVLPGTGDDASPEDLRGDVIGVLEKHGLRSVTVDDGVEVDAHWQRRIAT